MTDFPGVQHIDIGDDLSIAYREMGAQDAEHTVVFVHGSGPGASGHSNFKLNYPAFAGAGLRVLVPDALGYSDSSKPADAQYTLAFLVDGLSRFLDAKGIERCVLVGNSLGGAMSIQLALDQPDRVQKLVLMAPGGLEEREVFMQMRGIKRMLRCIFDPGGITAASMRRVFELQLFDAGLLTDETLAERVAVADTQPQSVFATSRVPNLAGRLGELSCPILCFWGMNDQFCPPSGAWRIAESCRDTMVVTLSECGHWVMVERRELFDRMAIGFVGA